MNTFNFTNFVRFHNATTQDGEYKVIRAHVSLSTKRISVVMKSAHDKAGLINSIYNFSGNRIDMYGNEYKDSSYLNLVNE